MRSMIALIIIIFFFTSSLYSVFHITWEEELTSSAVDIKINNDYAYILTSDNDIIIYLIENSSELVYQNQYHFDGVTKFFIDDEYLFTVAGFQISKYLIENYVDLQIQESGSFSLNHSYHNYTIDIIKNDLLALGSFFHHEYTSEAWVEVFNLQDVNNIQQVYSRNDFYDTGLDFNLVYDIYHFSSENYLYLKFIENDAIIDLNDLANINYYDFGNFASHIIKAISDEYIVTSTSLYQFSTPFDFSHIATLDTSFGYEGMFYVSATIQDNIVLLNNQHFYNIGLQEFDGYFNLSDNYDFDEECAIYSYSDGIRVVNITNPENQYEEWHFHVVKPSHEIHTAGNKLIVGSTSTWIDSLQIINIESIPYLEAEVPEEVRFFAWDHWLITTQYSTNNLILYNLDNVQQSSAYGNNGYLNVMAMKENILYGVNTINNIDYLEAISYEDPINPIILYNAELNLDYAMYFKILNDKLLIINGQFVQIYHINDVGIPEYYSIYQLQSISGPCTIDFKDNFLYLCRRPYPIGTNNILRIYDFNDIENPVLVNDIELNYCKSGLIEIISNTLFLLDNNLLSIYRFSLEDPINPALTDEFRWNSNVRNTCKYNENLIVSTFHNGIIAFSSSFTSSYDEVIINNDLSISNYPNPFNPSTEIRFQISDFSQIETVEISIYNIKGQKVKSFPEHSIGTQYDNDGFYYVIWNGDDECGKPVSSGVYLYKLNVNGSTEAVKKCLLLK